MLASKFYNWRYFQNLRTDTEILGFEADHWPTDLYLVNIDLLYGYAFCLRWKTSFTGQILATSSLRTSMSFWMSWHGYLMGLLILALHLSAQQSCSFLVLQVRFLPLQGPLDT